MGRRLWFISKRDEPKYVFPSLRSAQFELEALEREEEDGTARYRLYSVDIDDLEDHPDEMDLAEREGLL